MLSVSDIGISDPTNNGLQCVTDKMPCCDKPQTGMWFFPDGTTVPVKERATSYYVSRGHNDGTNIIVYLSVEMEELHRIAFRNAHSNPLYCPSFNISKHSHDDVSVGSSVFILILECTCTCS